MTEFGERLQELRKKRGLTLEKLGEKIGSSKSYVWELENKPGIRPSVETANNLAKALETTIAHLMGLPEDDEIEPADQAFFSRYQELDDPVKRKLRGILDVLDAEDN